jgi:hypothetical protein
MTEPEPALETSCASIMPHKMNRVQRNSYNESAFAFRESQKSPQHNPQFRVNMSKTN